MPRVSIGRYFAADSPVHRLDPRVKLIATLAYMVSCLFVHSAATLALAAATAAVAVRLSRVPARLLLAQLKPLALFLIATSAINLFFARTGTVLLALGPLQVHMGGLSAAILYTGRFFLLLVSGSLLMLTTTATALTDAAGKLLAPLERWGAPVNQVALIFSIALRFVPVLAQETDNIVAAQTARGAHLEGKSALAYARAYVPLAVPLFASALRHAENLGRAMDARCYTGIGRTHYHVMRLEPRRDGIAIAALLLYLAALTMLAVASL